MIRDWLLLCTMGMVVAALIRQESEMTAGAALGSPEDQRCIMYSELNPTTGCRIQNRAP